MSKKEQQEHNVGAGTVKYWGLALNNESIIRIAAD